MPVDLFEKHNITPPPKDLFAGKPPVANKSQLPWFIPQGSEQGKETMRSVREDISAGLGAFNRGQERYVHGALQPLLESTPLGDVKGFRGNTVRQASKGLAATREQERNREYETSPWSSGIGEIAGALNLTAPLAVAMAPGAVPSVAGAALTGGVQGGLMGATDYVPEGGSRLQNTIMGTTAGAVLGPVSHLVGSPNPITRMIASGLIGAATGYGIGGTAKSAAYGGMAGTTLGLVPTALHSIAGKGINWAADKLGLAKPFSAMGPMEKLAAYNVLKDIEDPNQAKAMVDAAQRQGMSYLTPGETGNATAMAEQAQSTMNPKAAQTFIPKAGARADEERAMTKGILDTISPEDAPAQFKPLYKAAEPQVMPKADVDKLYADKGIARQKELMMQDPRYMSELDGVPENTVHFLDSLEKFINSGTTKNAGEKTFQENQARKVGQVLRDNSPEHTQARAMADAYGTRQALEATMGGDRTAPGFMKGFNDADVQKRVARILKDNPAALAQYNLVGKLFKNIMPARTVKDFGKPGLPNVVDKLNVSGWLKSQYNKLLGGEYDKAVIALITDPNWTDKLAEVAKMKNMSMQRRAFIQLLQTANNVGVSNTNTAQPSEGTE